MIKMLFSYSMLQYVHSNSDLYPVFIKNECPCECRKWRWCFSPNFGQILKPFISKFDAYVGDGLTVQRHKMFTSPSANQ